MIRNEDNIQWDEVYKLALVTILLVACWMLTYYFHVILGKEVVFTHFFYVPIILSAIWWKRKALIVTTLLSFFLIITHSGVSFNIPLEDFVRILMFYFVTIVVVLLAESMDRSNQILKESEKKFRAVFNEVNDIITLTPLKDDGKPDNYIEVNNVAIKELGYSKDEFLQMNPSNISKKENTANKINELLSNKKVTFERTYLSKSGKEIPVEINSHIFEFSGRDVALSVARDITERKISENRLKESEERYRTLFELSPDYIILLDIDGRVIEVNNAVQRIIGSPENFIGKPFYELVELQGDIQTYHTKISDLLDGKDVKPYETSLVDRNDNEHWVVIYNTLLSKNGSDYGILIIANDITEIKRAENQLRISLSEKEMLLKEIHHRVKNNLMIISSLLNIQSRYIKDKEALGIFKESQNRAKSMALIHEKLYQSTDLKRIDMGVYIRTLSTDLFHTYVTDPSKIQLQIDVEDIMVDVNTSIPMGLIINELLTNSLKHAFPGDKKGKITISLHKKENNLKLEICDDGIGFPKDVDYKNTSSLGLQLVNSLSEQVDAQLKLISSQGTCFQIIFHEKTF